MGTRSQGYKSVFDSHSVVGSIPTRRNKLFNIFYFLTLVTRQSALLSFVNEHAMYEFGVKWRMECLNTRCPSAYPICRIHREAKKVNK